MVRFTSVLKGNPNSKQITWIPPLITLGANTFLETGIPNPHF